jgi:hypothetical protein
MATAKHEKKIVHSFLFSKKRKVHTFRNVMALKNSILRQDNK